ncbi:MAG: response regulator [Chloroflexi bacterium]|nr:response regulator [Chloroflexota bacterium]
MQKVIDWLETVEQLAHNLYREASVFFGKDKAFSEFLERLAEDEAQHVHLVSVAADYVRRGEVQATSAIILDQMMTNRIEVHLKRTHDSLSRQTISKERMIESIVQAEFSELNSLFLYVVNTMKAYDKTFQHVAAAVQAHKNRIERFLDTLPDESKPDIDIRVVPAVWQNKLLVVEDTEPLRVLLSELLESLGVVETAKNGKEALEKTREHFFSAVITDIDLPVMSGLKFYQRAIEEDPSVQPRFVFCSGDISFERKTFFKKNNVRYLLKPFDVDEIIQVVGDVIQATH